MDSNAFMTYSVGNLDGGDRVGRILAAALSAVEPTRAVNKHLQRSGSTLIAAGARYELDQYARIFLIGAGKASVPMAEAVAHQLGSFLTKGIISTKDGYGQAGTAFPTGVDILIGGHPIPDKRSLDATQQISSLLAETTQQDLVICVLSGGGSALLTAPYPGISLEDMQRLTQTLIGCGAGISEINTLRKHLDSVKGGGLARTAYPATLLTLILSDVVGNPMEVIASGPTVADPTTYDDALAVIQRHNLSENVPCCILEHLQRGVRGEIPETAKPGDDVFERTDSIVLGSNYQAASAAISQAVSEGFHTMLLTTYLEGEARQAGRSLAAIARQINATGEPLPRPACVIAGGETTVFLKGNGLGGRNQELALGAVADLAGIDHSLLVALATDGGDGPTDAAGAVVTGDTLSRASNLDLDLADFLDRNDAYHFFLPLDDLLQTGPTMTNVNDLMFLFLF